MHLPHMRGDEPDEVVKALEEYAHLPHMRGDEPPLQQILLDENMTSAPHEWGLAGDREGKTADLGLTP